MALTFRSLRSSSSGNSLMLSTETTSILLDCGIKTKGGCLDLLRPHARKLNAAVISHAHGDHICYYSMRVLEEMGIPLYCHQEIVAQVQDQGGGNGDSLPDIRAFIGTVFRIGDIDIQPVPLPHAPNYPNFGFVIWCGTGKNRRKLVICTDFHDYGAILDHLAGAAFVFVEANYDPELLRQHWNPSSLYHLSNPKTAELLCRAKQNGQFSPQTVMLGHLSRQRNTAELAVDTIKGKFKSEGVDLGFRLEVAPRYEMSQTVVID